MQTFYIHSAAKDRELIKQSQSHFLISQRGGVCTVSFLTRLLLLVQHTKSAYPLINI